jgi:hypothetical protein
MSTRVDFDAVTAVGPPEGRPATPDRAAHDVEPITGFISPPLMPGNSPGGVAPPALPTRAPPSAAAAPPSGVPEAVRSISQLPELPNTSGSFQTGRYLGVSFATVASSLGAPKGASDLFCTWVQKLQHTVTEEESSKALWEKKQHQWNSNEPAHQKLRKEFAMGARNSVSFREHQRQLVRSRARGTPKKKLTPAHSDSEWVAQGRKFESLINTKLGKAMVVAEVAQRALEQQVAEELEKALTATDLCAFQRYLKEQVPAFQPVREEPEESVELSRRALNPKVSDPVHAV